MVRVLAYVCTARGNADGMRELVLGKQAEVLDQQGTGANERLHPRRDRGRLTRCNEQNHSRITHAPQQFLDAPG